MIDNALNFVVNELNRYVVRKLDPTLDPSITKRVMLGNVTKVQEGENSNDNPLLNKIILTLVNVEEDRISRPQQNYVKVNDKIEYRNPKVFLNLYCLFSVHHNTYNTSLQYLSLVIQYFQHKNVINHKNSPASAEPRLDVRIDKLIFDMITLNFEQINHLWGTLGGKYLPSVLFKMRLITIEDDTPEMQGEPILKMRIDGQSTNS